MLLERDALLCELKANLLASHNRMKLKADEGRRELQFEEGDLVLVKLHPYRQESVERRISLNLAKRYRGPFKVLAKMGKITYKIEIPQGTRIHNVFTFWCYILIRGQLFLQLSRFE